MIWSMFKEEFSRHKLIHTILVFFMSISSMLLASAVFIVVVLFSGVNQLMDKGDAPHFIQMHVGEVDQEIVDDFNESIPYIKKYQQLEMISISGEELFVKDDETSEVKSVMDVSLITQNEDFDFLLDQNNQIAVIEEGMIGVPVYYQLRYDLSLGDKISLQSGDERYTFVIDAFIRDSQMNPSLVSSKRFVISNEDYTSLKEVFTAKETVFEYQFDSTKRLGEFYRAYRSSEMPAGGPTVDIRLFRTLSSLTDGLVVLVLVMLSGMLMMIGLLSLRFTLLGTIEEDIKEIGVLRAIGLTTKKIRMLYVMKYGVMAAVACSIGYVLSLFVNQVFLGNIDAYLGKVDIGAFVRLIPLLGSVFVFLIIVFGVYRVLKKINQYTIVQAITHQGEVGKIKRKKRRKKRHPRYGVSMFLSMKAIWQHKKSYRLMMFVFVSALIMMVVPAHVVTTLSSEDFLGYMGVGESDMRIDIRSNEEASVIEEEIMDYLGNDEDIEEFAIYHTYQMVAYNQDDEVEQIPIEIGHIEAMQLNYIEGRAPESDQEIALSVLALRSLDSSLNEYVRVDTAHGEELFYVSGVYQDITNGGNTAKGRAAVFGDDTLWIVVNVTFKDGVDVAAKETDYSEMFTGVKITQLSEYLDQTLGNTIDQLRIIRYLSLAIGLIISMLITGLFLKLLMAKEAGEIAIKSSLGFSKRDLTIQYVLRMMLVLLMSMVIGGLLIRVLGEEMVSVISGIFGASRLSFVVHPLSSYGLAITLLLGLVFGTSLMTVLFYDMKKMREHLTV